MFKNYLSKIIPFTILPVAFISVQRFSYSPIGNTFMYWFFQLLILLAFWKASNVFFESENKHNIRFVKWYLLWNVFSIIRGIFIAETYWDWKGLISIGMALLIPLIAYTASNKEYLQSILSFYIKYALPFSIVVFPFLPIGACGWYLFPVSLLMLFFPALKLRWKVLILSVSLFAILADLTTRSYLFKYGTPMLLLFFYYFRFLTWSDKIMGLTRKIFLIAPWVFFFLAVSGIFNVFRIDEYIKGNYVSKTKDTEGHVVESNLATDSRTFLYEEVLKSAQKYNYWILGRSPARGNETEFFADLAEISGRKERLVNEAGILNVFTWTGIIGVILYFLVFYRASFLAVNKSNNIYIKLIGLFVAFRWMYGWAEDYNTFILNNYVIWLMIGICFSESFRKMNNAEVKLWVRGIFENRYFVKYKEYALNYMT